MGNKIWSNETQSYQRETEDGAILTEFVCHHIAPGDNPWKGTGAWVAEAENEEEFVKLFRESFPDREIYKVTLAGRSTIRQWPMRPDLIPTTIYGHGNPNE